MKLTFTKRCPVCDRAEGLHRVRRSFAARLFLLPIQTRSYYCPYCDKGFMVLGNGDKKKVMG